MSVPAWSLKIDRTAAPKDTADFETDITAYAQKMTVVRGRTLRSGRMNPGTLEALLVNNDGRFDSDYSLGAYSPDIDAMLHVKLTADWDPGGGTVTYPIIYVYADEWTNRSDSAGNIHWCDFRGTDGFKRLARHVIQGASYPEELSSARVTRVLDEIDWDTSSTLRSISIGVILVQAIDVSGVSALEHLHLVSDSEDGNFFIGNDGKFVFQDRGSRWLLTNRTSKATFSDDGVDLPYHEIVTEKGDNYVRNKWDVHRRGGEVQSVSNAASVAAYGTQSRTKSNLLMLTDAEAQTYASRGVTTEKDTNTRIRSMTFYPKDDSDLWAQFLGRELGDVITIKRNAFGEVETYLAVIEGIKLDIDILDARLSKATFYTSAQPPTTLWILGDTTYGITGSTTYLGY